MIPESEKARQHWLITGFFALKSHTSDPCICQLAYHQLGEESLLVLLTPTQSLLRRSSQSYERW